jgi:transcriptional regulator with XRE-family HTH domain
MTFEIENKNKEEAAKKRASRLKSLREMTGLSRNDFHKRYGIPRGTLQNWESARFGGLTMKGAKNIIRAFTAEGINCDIDWLLYGTGSSPKFTESTQGHRNQELKKHHDVNEHIFEAETNIITKEILLFRQNHENSIDIVVADDGMQPLWSAGDYIAGVKRYQDDIRNTIGKYCIVQTHEYGNLFRKLTQGEDENLYNLTTINHNSKIKKPVLYNVSVISSAPVIWTRKIDIVSY